MLLLLLTCCSSALQLQDRFTCAGGVSETGGAAAWVMEPAEADFGHKMRSFLFQSPNVPTKQ